MTWCIDLKWVYNDRGFWRSGPGIVKSPLDGPRTKFPVEQYLCFYRVDWAAARVSECKKTR